MDNLSNSTPIIKTPPNLENQPSIYLRQRDFDATVWGKSYDVFIDKAIKCPCRNIPDSQAQIRCKNCGGTGWVFINRVRSRTVLQSMNLDTKFKEWSEEKLGVGKMTFLSDERISFMDKITILNGEMLTTELLFPKVWSTGQQLMCRTIYPVKEVEYCFLFTTVEEKLTRLRVGEDFTIEKGQYIVLDSQYASIENLTVTLRYLHNPVYHVIDLPRVVMTTPEFDKLGGGVMKDSRMPLLASVRLSHFILNTNTLNGDWLLDNTDYEPCKDEPGSKAPETCPLPTP